MEIVNQKEPKSPCRFCGEPLVIYAEDIYFRAMCKKCGIHTMTCPSPAAALDAYHSIGRVINKSQEPILERSENVRVARRAVVIDEICKRLGAVAFIKGPLNELHEIATKVKELK